MAFTTTSITGLNLYNVDHSVGWGAKGNRPEDIMLVQALFRIVHFELPEDERMKAPAGDTSIAVDGILGPVTNRFIGHWQRLMSEHGMPTLRDGIVDPFRGLEELSHRARVRYALEVLTRTTEGRCRTKDMTNYSGLAQRDDIPVALATALSQRRSVALKYQQGASAA